MIILNLKIIPLMTYFNSSTLLHGKSLKWKLIINFNYFSYIRFRFRSKWQSFTVVIIIIIYAVVEIIQNKKKKA